MAMLSPMSALRTFPSPLSPMPCCCMQGYFAYTQPEGTLSA